MSAPLIRLPTFQGLVQSAERGDPPSVIRRKAKALTRFAAALGTVTAMLLGATSATGLGFGVILLVDSGGIGTSQALGLLTNNGLRLTLGTILTLAAVAVAISPTFRCPLVGFFACVAVAATLCVCAAAATVGALFGGAYLAVAGFAAPSAFASITAIAVLSAPITWRP